MAYKKAIYLLCLSSVALSFAIVARSDDEAPKPAAPQQTGCSPVSGASAHDQIVSLSKILDPSGKLTKMIADFHPHSGPDEGPIKRSTEAEPSKPAAAATESNATAPVEAPRSTSPSTEEVSSTTVVPSSTTSAAASSSSSTTPSPTVDKSTESSNVTVNVFLQLVPDAKTEDIINNPEKTISSTAAPELSSTVGAAAAAASSSSTTAAPSSTTTTSAPSSSTSTTSASASASAPTTTAATPAPKSLTPAAARRRRRRAAPEGGAPAASPASPAASSTTQTPSSTTTTTTTAKITPAAASQSPTTTTTTTTTSTAAPTSSSTTTTSTTTTAAPTTSTSTTTSTTTTQKPAARSTSTVATVELSAKDLPAEKRADTASPVEIVVSSVASQAPPAAAAPVAVSPTPAATTTTSAAPLTTSAAPPTTSAAPSSTSAAPSSTSAAPSTTSAAPSTTSAAPSITSAAPSTTSAAPSSTSALPPAELLQPPWGSALLPATDTALAGMLREDMKEIETTKQSDSNVQTFEQSVPVMLDKMKNKVYEKEEENATKQANINITNATTTTKTNDGPTTTMSDNYAILTSGNNNGINNSATIDNINVIYDNDTTILELPPNDNYGGGPSSNGNSLLFGKHNKSPSKMDDFINSDRTEEVERENYATCLLKPFGNISKQFVASQIGQLNFWQAINNRGALHVLARFRYTEFSGENNLELNETNDGLSRHLVEKRESFRAPIEHIPANGMNSSSTDNRLKKRVSQIWMASECNTVYGDRKLLVEVSPSVESPQQNDGSKIVDFDAELTISRFNLSGANSILNKHLIIELPDQILNSGRDRELACCKIKQVESFPVNELDNFASISVVQPVREDLSIATMPPSSSPTTTSNIAPEEKKREVGDSFLDRIKSMMTTKP